MRIVKRSTRNKPRLGLILLDWSVRESFHILHYLANQTVARDSFEVIVVEFYSRESEAIKKYESQVDTWLLLQMPEACYYHKHLMYNAGIVVSTAEIFAICDSDAMVRKSFVESVIRAFEEERRLGLHLDQFRNERREFYPFNYPSFEEVIGRGCVGNVNGKTKGIVDRIAPFRLRNYGACMCARREDVIRIGGADEHIDYLGHICGPYEMTFRLLNHGCCERWHETEFLYHTWHPGQGGKGNYLGPHDGRHTSTTALEALVTGRIFPYRENGAIKILRERGQAMWDELQGALINPEYYELWRAKNVENRNAGESWARDKFTNRMYKGFWITHEGGTYTASLPVSKEYKVSGELIMTSNDCDELKRMIDLQVPALPLMLHDFLNLPKAVIHIMALGVQWVTKRLFDIRGHDRDAFQGVSVAARGCQDLSHVGGHARNALAGIWRPIKEKWTLLCGKWGQLQGRNTVPIVNLWAIRNGQNRGVKVVVLTSTSWSLYAMKIMAILGMLPCIDIVRIADRTQVNHYLKMIETMQDERAMIVSAELYIEHHDVLQVMRPKLVVL